MKNSRTWIELSKENLLHNVRELRRIVGDDCIVCPTVKANGYGHGMVEVAPLLVEGGADWLAVDSLAEACELRDSGIEVPIYIMGQVPLSELGEVVKRDFRVVIYNKEAFEALSKACKDLEKEIKVHLKVETGTNRQGVLEKDLDDWIEGFKAGGSVKLEGVCTHFANIEDTTDHSFALGQLEKFNNILGRLKDNGVEPGLSHCANSAALILFPETHFGMVRPGLAVYGMWPSRETFVSAREKGVNLDLRPVMSWKTRVAEVKDVAAGEPIGYGCTYKTTRDSHIVVLPVGFYNRYPRALSNNARVLIRGKSAPVRGRVMMNMIVADVTDIPGVELEDEVVLLGAQGDERITAEELADAQGTINYEVTTQIQGGIDRRVV